jgi:hypothetical protein
MLILSHPTLKFKNVEDGDFVKYHNGGVKFLEIFLTSLTSDVNATQVEVFSLNIHTKNSHGFFPV